MSPSENNSPRNSGKRYSSTKHRVSSSSSSCTSPILIRCSSARGLDKKPRDSQISFSSPPKSFKYSSSSENSGSNNYKDDHIFVPPTPEESTRIVEQMEFYFSDVNIMKDTFLLQHIKHNKDGYISLKLLSGFKRIKHLVRSWRELVYALEHGDSTLLQLNEERTKIRRIAPLPSYDETAPSRTVVAFDLPLEKPVTIKSVVSLFAPCGRLVLVRVLLPKNPIPADVRPFVANLPELQTNGEACALVEFADLDGVKYAIGRRPACAQAAPLDWGNMRVLSLTQPSSSLTKLNKPYIIQLSKPTVKPLAPNNNGGGKPPLTYNKQEQQLQSRSPHVVFLNVSRASYQNRCPSPVILTSGGGGSCNGSPTSSPRVLRRDRKGDQHDTLRRSSCPTIEFMRRGCDLPPNVIRLPRGPDGTKGFLRTTERVPVLV